jgi:hypothetical protein
MPSTPVKNRTHPHPTVTDDTPIKSKQAVSAPAICGGINSGREAVMSDAGDAVPQVPLEWFKQYILPPLPTELDLGKIMKRLRRAGVVTGSGWRYFPKEPHDSKDKVEDVVFAPFEDIARSVGDAAEHCFARSCPEPTVKFRCNPRCTPLSSNRQNSSKPDGYGLYTSHVNYRATEDSRDVFWELIVAPGEVKKNARLEDINDVSFNM